MSVAIAYYRAQRTNGEAKERALSKPRRTHTHACIYQWRHAVWNKITRSQSRPRARLITSSRDGRRLTSLDGVIDRSIFATFKGFNDARGGPPAITNRPFPFRANARPDRFILSEYRGARKRKRGGERETACDPIGTEDRIAAMHSRSFRICTRNTIHKPIHKREPLRTTLAPFLSRNFFFCIVFTHCTGRCLRKSLFYACLCRGRETPSKIARAASVKMIYRALMLQYPN